MEQANFIKFSAFLVGKRVELEKHMNIDGKEEEISTRADGYWGDCQEFSHTHKGKETLDAVIITVFMPEFENLSDMRGRMHYFFTGVCQIDGPEECTGHQIK